MKMVSKPTKALDSITIGRQITKIEARGNLRGNSEAFTISLEQFIKYYLGTFNSAGIINHFNIYGTKEAPFMTGKH